MLFGAPPQPTIRPGAPISSAFRDGRPGTYEVAVTVEAVPLESAVTPFFDPSRWTTALTSAGINGRVTAVKYAGSSNYRSTNWASDYIDEILGRGGTARQIADVRYQLTVILDQQSNVAPQGMTSGSGVGGLGLAPAAVGVIVLGALAAAFTAISYFTGKNVLIDSVKAIGTAVGSGVAEIGSGLGKALVPIALVAVGLILVLGSKSGGRATKGIRGLMR